jgi:hypothetical protein
MLPFELKRCLVYYLSVPHVCCLARVNREYSQLMHDNGVWRMLCLRDHEGSQELSSLPSLAMPLTSMPDVYRKLYVYACQTKEAYLLGLKRIVKLYKWVLKYNDTKEVTEEDREWFEASREENIDDVDSIYVKFYYSHLPLLVGTQGGYLGCREGREIVSVLTILCEIQYNGEGDRCAYQITAQEKKFSYTYISASGASESRVSVVDDPWIGKMPLPSVAQACGLDSVDRCDGKYYDREVRLTMDSLHSYIDTALASGYHPIAALTKSMYLDIPEGTIASNPEFFVIWC